jgi:hypothetical protein
VEDFFHPQFFCLVAKLQKRKHVLPFLIRACLTNWKHMPPLRTRMITHEQISRKDDDDQDDDDGDGDDDDDGGGHDDDDG